MQIQPKSLLIATIILSLGSSGANGSQDATTAPPSDAGATAGAGLKQSVPIEVCGPTGEREYLDRLRCSDGGRVKYERSGSVGYRSEPVTPEDKKAAMDQMMHVPIKTGQKDFHMIDAYKVQCSGKSEIVYLDMYHCPQPKESPVPPGYTLSS